jgi:uncharacterized protein with FMN-binding domain
MVTAMSSSLRTKYTFGALAGLTLIGTLAGCSAADTSASADDASDSTPSSESSSSTDTSTDSGTDTGTDSSAAGTYTDGTYSAEGDYQAPGESETIEVEVTLEGDIVTAVTVTPQADSGNAARYQKEFAEGISDIVVGENIDDLNVDRVAGSSLTSTGFNAAIEEIKADALG